MDYAEIIGCIKGRRSVRAYRPDPVDGEQLAALLEAASWAPSGTNRQEWLFAAICGEKLDELNGVVKEALLATDPDDPVTKRSREAAQKEGFTFCYHAPILIVASGVENLNVFSDCACGLQNIFLAAHAMGLGSCWINLLRRMNDNHAIREHLAALGIPREHVICGAAAVGHPAQNPDPPARKDGTTRIIR